MFKVNITVCDHCALDANTTSSCCHVRAVCLREGRDAATSDQLAEV